MDRAAAIVTARKLKALADHPDTPVEEAKSAREKLLSLRSKHLITDRELAAEEPSRQWTRHILYREIERNFGSRVADGFYRVFALDHLINSIEDRHSRDLVDSTLASIVAMISGGRK